MRTTVRIILIPFILLFLYTSCRKDDLKGPEITPQQARDSLYDIMNDWYYWYKTMPLVNKENYPDPYSLLDALRNSPLDRWSFVADYDEFNAQMQGSFVGHGIRIGIDETEKARISMIYSGSDLYKAGVRRGWIIKTINNADIAQILISGDATAYSNLIGPAATGITNIFVFIRPDGIEETIQSTKSSFVINTVLHYDTLHLSSGITGHLVFESFIEPSADELQRAFAFFKAQNVQDLILDLRYNSGGFLDIARTLASYIAGNGPASTQSTFARLTYNDKKQAVNVNYTFRATALPLNLQKLVVITTKHTASASEAVINGLVPFVDVVCIGDTTTGKPTGMNGWPVGRKYWFWPVTFKIVNANNEGDYFGGIIPEKLVPDDITRDFNDRNELCLREAIHFLQTGTLSGKGITEFPRYRTFSEKPSWMDNAFIRENQ